MQESSPEGRHMSEETFEQVLDFCREAQPLLVSVTGGEPTEHPQLAHIVHSLRNLPSVKLICILTNGTWIEDSNKRITMAQLIREAKGAIKVQVYSHYKYYRDHDWTVEHEQQFRSIGCIPDFNAPIFMQDLGRARQNCQEETAASNHVPSCINSHLIAVQTGSLPQFFTMSAMVGKFCRPLVDINGNIHMSESWLCPSVAHVSHGATEAFRRMQISRPCKRCKLYSNFVKLHPREMAILEEVNQ
ncbi:MAG: 4Fe-4S cluster-binding domain-containing protein [Bacteroidaceae bacterium]|nr:4Fe-4S cluster-binding domain-containing protein [Bacteroidaceae bacterium]